MEHESTLGCSVTNSFTPAHSAPYLAVVMLLCQACRMWRRFAPAAESIAGVRLKHHVAVADNCRTFCTCQGLSASNGRRHVSSSHSTMPKAYTSVRRVSPGGNATVPCTQCNNPCGKKFVGTLHLVGDDFRRQPARVVRRKVGGCGGGVRRAGQVEIAYLWHPHSDRLERPRKISMFCTLCRLRAAGSGQRHVQMRGTIEHRTAEPVRMAKMRRRTFTRQCLSTSRFGDLRSRCRIAGWCECSCSSPCINGQQNHQRYIVDTGSKSTNYLLLACCSKYSMAVSQQIAASVVNCRVPLRRQAPCRDAAASLGCGPSPAAPLPPMIQHVSASHSAVEFHLSIQYRIKSEQSMSTQPVKAVHAQLGFRGNLAQHAVQRATGAELCDEAGRLQAHAHEEHDVGVPDGRQDVDLQRRAAAASAHPKGAPQSDVARGILNDCQKMILTSLTTRTMSFGTTIDARPKVLRSPRARGPASSSGGCCHCWAHGCRLLPGC